MNFCSMLRTQFIKSYCKWGLIAIALISTDVCAQTLTSKEWESISKDDNYYIGRGISTDYQEAREYAKSDLVNKVSSSFESRFDYVAEEVKKQNKISSKEVVNNVIRSYSFMQLHDFDEYCEKNRSEYIVNVCIKKGLIREMFRNRVKMAQKWLKEAETQEREKRIGDALQYYYWSLALLRSCPDSDLETLDTGSHTKMIPEVFQRVKELLEKIKVNAISSKQEGNRQRVTLDVTYDGQPAVNFNYRLSDAKSDADKLYNSTYSGEIYSAKDGVGEIVLPAGAKLKNLKIVAEYEFREEANIHPELSNVICGTTPVPFHAAIIKVDTKDCSVNSQYVMEIASLQTQEKTGNPASLSTKKQMDAITDLTSILSLSDATPYLSTMKIIEQGISQKNFGSLKDYFTPEGWKMFERLISYGEAKLLRSPQVEFIRYGSQVVCRSFPMSFSFKGNRRVFAEDVVFYFNPEAKVTEVAFGLEQTAVNDIMCRDNWSMEARHVMVHFLETYKTAYALKRWDYINSIFSNEALIITGSVVKGTGQKEMGPAKIQHVRYIRQTKEQYMSSLKKCFDSNEYINIHFADNIVRRSSKNGNIYGIQIKQDYYSSTYGDTGYLFLMIDFKDPGSPIIHVRTWQPDNDPNVRDGRIGITDFQL